MVREIDGIIVAQKRWGHGRLRQLARRAVCRLRGHDWSAWGWRDEGVRGRRCERACGAHNLRRLDDGPLAVAYDDLERP